MNEKWKENETKKSGDSGSVSSLVDSFHQFTLRLRQREIELDKREMELDDRTKSLEKENPLLGKSSGVVRLNVLGTKMDVLRRTLTSVEGSFLAAQFSGRWDEALPQDCDGNVLINQPFELWKPMIDYLLDKECETPLCPGVTSPTFSDDRLTKRFHRMVEYYQMTLGVYPFNLCKINSPNGIGEVVASHPTYAVENADNFASYSLLQADDVHSRRVKTFEITMGAFTSISVGWADRALTDLYSQYAEGRGVGYAKGSIALDCSKSSIVYKTSESSASATTTHIPGLLFTPGCVIRCEEYGQKWSVNGKVVAACGGDIGGVRSIPGWTRNESTATPLISVQGCFRVSKIEIAFP